MTRSRLCLFNIHVIKGKLLTSRNVLKSEECQVVNSSVEAIVAHSEQAAVGVAAVVDEACRSAHLLSVSHVAITLVQCTELIVVFGMFVEREQVRSFVIASRGFASGRLSISDQFTEITINVLPSFEVDRATQTFVAC